MGFLGENKIWENGAGGMSQYSINQRMNELIKYQLSNKSGFVHKNEVLDT